MTTGRRPRWFEVCDLAVTDPSAGWVFHVRSPKEWERQILAPLSHQGAMPFDQFVRFFDYSSAEAEEVIAHIVSCGYAQSREILTDEPAWIWLTGPGTRVSGTGLSPFELLPGSIARLRAINEVRLHLAQTAPHACWTSQRCLRRIHGGQVRVPSAMIEIEGERHAIEVRVNPYNLPYVAAMIEARLAEYDAVICFAPPRVCRLLERLRARHGWREVLIRNLPGG
jgi:hypothetical protein